MDNLLSQGNLKSNEAALAAVVRGGKDIQNGSAAAANAGKGLPASADVGPAREAQEAKQTQARVDAAVDKLNDYMASQQRDLRFSIDSELGRPVVQVVDANSDKVVRQIPSEVVIRLARNLNDAIRELQVSVDGYGGSATNAASNGINGQLIDTKA